jgi:hypothetical protein
MKKTDHAVKNPAGRLHQFLSKAKRHADPAQPARLWGSVFDIPISSKDINQDELIAVVERLREFQTLIEETENGLGDLQEIDRRYFEPFQPIKKVVFVSLMGLNQNVGGLLNPVTERHMTLLELAAAEWARRQPEPEVDEQQLQEILKQTRELFETVKAATDISDDLRKVLLSMLASIEHAIQEYHIVGPLALEKGIVQILGQLRWNQPILEKGSEASEGSTSRNLLKRVGAIGTALIAIMTFANTTHKTIGTFAPDVLFLASGNPEIPPVKLVDVNADEAKNHHSDATD